MKYGTGLKFLWFTYFSRMWGKDEVPNSGNDKIKNIFAFLDISNEVPKFFLETDFLVPQNGRLINLEYYTI